MFLFITFATKAVITETQKHAKSHKKPQNATKRHKTPQNATKRHKITVLTTTSLIINIHADSIIFVFLVTVSE